MILPFVRRRVRTSARRKRHHQPSPSDDDVPRSIHQRRGDQSTSLAGRRSQGITQIPEVTLLRDLSEVRMRGMIAEYSRIRLFWSHWVYLNLTAIMRRIWEDYNFAWLEPDQNCKHFFLICWVWCVYPQGQRSWQVQPILQALHEATLSRDHQKKGWGVPL